MFCNVNTNKLLHPCFAFLLIAPTSRIQNSIHQITSERQRYPDVTFIWRNKITAHSQLQARSRLTLNCRLGAVSLSTAGQELFHSQLQARSRFTLNCRLGAVSLSTAGQEPFHSQLQARSCLALNCRLGAVSLSFQV